MKLTPEVIKRLQSTFHGPKPKYFQLHKTSSSVPENVDVDDADTDAVVAAVDVNVGVALTAFKDESLASFKTTIICGLNARLAEYRLFLDSNETFFVCTVLSKVLACTSMYLMGLINY